MTLTRELDMAHWTSVNNVLSARDKYAVIAEACCVHYGVPKTEVYIGRKVGHGKKKKDGFLENRTLVRVCLCAIFTYDFGIMQSELVSQFGQNVYYYAMKWRTMYEKIFYTQNTLNEEEQRMMNDIVAIYRISTKMLDERGHTQAAKDLRESISDKRMIYERR